MSNFIKVQGIRINTSELSDYGVANNSPLINVSMKNGKEFVLSFCKYSEQTEVARVFDACVSGTFDDERLRKKYLVQ